MCSKEDEEEEGRERERGRGGGVQRRWAESAAGDEDGRMDGEDARWRWIVGMKARRMRGWVVAAVCGGLLWAMDRVWAAAMINPPAVLCALGCHSRSPPAACVLPGARGIISLRLQ